MYRRAKRQQYAVAKDDEDYEEDKEEGSDAEFDLATPTFEDPVADRTRKRKAASQVKTEHQENNSE